MNVICNDCVGGELYKLYNEQYENPFIWTILPFNDFLKLYKNYDKIDFKKVKYSETPNYYFFWYMSSLIIDNKIHIYFPHHINYFKYTELTNIRVKITNQNGLGYCKMDKYLIDTYKRRVERMEKSTPPVFIFSQENRNSETDIKKLLDEAVVNKYKLIFITSEEKWKEQYNNCDNIRFLIKEQNEILQKTQAEAIKNNLEEFFR